jgi:hypothetical protein
VSIEQHELLISMCTFLGQSLENLLFINAKDAGALPGQFEL